MSSTPLQFSETPSKLKATRLARSTPLSELSGCTVTIPTWRRARLLFQHGNGLGYYSNLATHSVTIATWRRDRSEALVRAD